MDVLPSVGASRASAELLAERDDDALGAADVAEQAAQALDLGLLDGVSVSLVPVVPRKGIPYFANLVAAPHRFDDPVAVPGVRAAHLTYAICR